MKRSDLKTFQFRKKTQRRLLIHFFSSFVRPRVATGSDRKQFFSSDPTKNKNGSDPILRKILKIASDPIRFNLIRQYASLIWLKWIGFSKTFASASAIGSKSNHKTASVGVKPTNFRRTSDPTRPPQSVLRRCGGTRGGRLTEKTRKERGKKKTKRRIKNNQIIKINYEWDHYQGGHRIGAEASILVPI